MDPHFEGVIFQTHAEELHRRLSRPFPPLCVLDVRPRNEWQRGRVPGALSVDPRLLAKGLPNGTDSATEFIVVGEGPGDPIVRATSDVLKRLGAHRRVEFGGGMESWRLHKLPVESGDLS